MRRAAVGLVMLVACGESTSPAGDPVLTTVLAQFASAEPMFSTGLSRGGAADVGPSGSFPAPCLFSLAGGAFVCPEITKSGISVQRSYELLDAGGFSLPEFDAAKVTAVRVVSTASGIISITGTTLHPGSTTSFTSSGTHTYSGLQTAIREINGTATMDVTITRNGKVATSTSTLTVSHITPPLTQAEVDASDGFGFPKSGKIITAVSGIDTLGVAFTAQVETTFDGTPFVVTKVGKNGVTVTYTCEYTKNTTGGFSQTFVACLVS